MSNHFHTFTVMNPYHILGIPTTATDLEIKRAYRTQVKRYHPDGGSLESSHDRSAELNYAYDILSDPQKRAEYDRGYTSLFYVVEEPQEDPLEAYKREYKRKRWAREKKEREEKLARKKAIYRALRYLHIPVLLFGLGLMLTHWLDGEGLSFWYTSMTGIAAYICYQRDLTDFAYKLAQYNLFVAMMTLLILVA